MTPAPITTPLQTLLQTHVDNLISRLNSAENRRLNNISVSHFALILGLLPGPSIAVEDTAERAGQLFHDLKAWSEWHPARHDLIMLPPPASPESIGIRAVALEELAASRSAVVITSPDALSVDLGSAGRSVVLEQGKAFARSSLISELASLGYRKVSMVMEQGEYAERGWLFDIYPVTAQEPVRVEFFGDEIELMRTFDIETQRSLKETGRVALYPAREGASPGSVNAVEALSVLGQLSGGTLFVNARAAASLDAAALSALSAVIISHLPLADGIDSGRLPVAGMGILPEERSAPEDLAAAIGALTRKTVIALSSRGQIDRLRELLRDGGVVAPLIDIGKVATYEGPICLTTCRLSAGLHIPDALILTDHEIFGEMPAFRPLKKSKVSQLLLSLDDLKPGDFVVHRDHGIGRFIGLQHETIEEHEADVIIVEYAGGDRLYIPFQGIERLQKYSAAEGHIPVLDRLGSTRWQTTKRKVHAKVREMAEKLLRLYAERSVARGFVFSEDTAMHAEFDDFFPYEETEDQIKAFHEIRRRMQSDNPMDLLICGDVGYGKTEVAIKAAFRAVYDHKQVAVLVPTTLLSEQHYRTFSTRFSAFPVKVDSLSRFKNPKEVKATLEKLAKGETDIIIGTHMLLGKNVRYQDLGLLIIDEEHRFGVAQKERLKELSKGVDIITLTATPIPRTLHLSLSGIREMAVIETPPEDRLAVRTVVAQHKDALIKEAVERELRRDGQVFFVHNRIGDIERVAARIQQLVPAARIAFAHGQMQERQLERIMLSFLNKERDILVSTAIIGAGLDIPTANTIIIDRADTFGLADLYQLRGRVGRGSRQAFAYLLIPGEDALTDDARKRLLAVQEMGYLGAGFRLALKDLEIRGAGNLLGGEQSGHIYKVGFDLYMEMLERAVAELKGAPPSEDWEPQISFPLTAFIPESYISDMTLRLSIYKRIALLKNLKAAVDMVDELADRFGPVPVEVQQLLGIVRLKILAKGLYISKIVEHGGRCRFTVIDGANQDEAAPRLPEGLASRMLAALMAMPKGKKAKPRLQLLQQGFEIETGDTEKEEALAICQRVLSDLTAQVLQQTDKSASITEGSGQLID